MPMPMYMCASSAPQLNNLHFAVRAVKKRERGEKQKTRAAN